MIKIISFVFQKIWQKHRGLLCYLILCVLSSLGISVVAVWFPAFVVSRISTGKADAAQLAAAGLVAFMDCSRWRLPGGECGSCFCAGIFCMKSF